MTADHITAPWIRKALDLGFSAAAALDVTMLQPRADIRDMCAQDRCAAYGKNWTCPPHCGTLEDCSTKLQGYSRGVLLQTVGQLRKTIDTKGYQAAEERHLDLFRQFCGQLREVYPNALCLGSGGCRLCGSCAWPLPCRFPDQAYSSMEAFGLFVTQVCRDHGIPYHHGDRTVTYTACVLF